VQVSGVDDGIIPHIKDTVMNALSGEYIGLISRANVLFYPRKQIEEEIMAKFDEAAMVKVDSVDRHTVRVSIKEKDPAGLLCPTLPDFNGNDILLDNPSSCYFVDESGFIFKKAPSFSGDVYSRYYVPDLAPQLDASASSTLVGLFATSTAEFKIVHEFYDIMKRNNIVTDALLMKGGGEYELYIRNPGESSSTAVIYFNTLSSTTEQAANFLSFWNHMTATASGRGESIQFDYIDVRYGDNVYHRLVR
jgi:hypothetical protein